MMRILEYFSRIFVGNLFIFSGIVKANDPLGFSYKLDEYFVEFGMAWEWLLDLALPLATIICIVEIILGIAVLVGYKMKTVSWLLLLMILFFTVLTFASAVFEIVRSCGCFGDAIPLTPYQSFQKDVILLIFIVILFIRRKKIEPFETMVGDIAFMVISMGIMAGLSVMLEWTFPLIFTAVVLGLGLVVKQLAPPKAALVTVVLGTLGSIWLTFDVLRHLPQRDFRPYAVGKNLPEQMVIPPDAKQPVYETRLTYKNKVSGEVKEMSMEEYSSLKLYEDPNWEWQDTETKLIEAGFEPKITDLAITDFEGTDYTDQFLNEEVLLLVIAYDLSKTETDQVERLIEIAEGADRAGYPLIALSAAGYEQSEAFRHENGTPFPFYVTDGTVLKTIVRSNPGFLLLKKGTVVGKWHNNDLPTFSEIKSLI